MKINQVIQGDCLQVMKDIPDNSIDMVLTSPPYDNLRTYNDNLEWGEHVWKPIIEELYRIVKKGGVVVWIVGDATIKGSETGTSFKQALWAMECGFNLHDTMIWDKGGFSAVGALKVRYAPVFEYMFIFSKGKPNTFNPIKDKKNKHDNVLISKTKRLQNGETKKGKSYVSKKYGQRYNIWQISPQGNITKHPAPFPEQLIRDHIISWSNEGDIILDPLAGSGTVGKMAKMLSRNYILIEKEPEYISIIKQRLQAG